VLEAIERSPPGEYEASRIYREVMVPLRLERHRQLRVLLCVRACRPLRESRWPAARSLGAEGSA
jgi:hypothetical protein